MDYQQRLDAQLWGWVTQGLDLDTVEGMKEVSRRIREDYPCEQFDMLTDYMVREQNERGVTCFGYKPKRTRSFSQLIAETLPPGWVVTNSEVVKQLKDEGYEVPDVRGFLIPDEKDLRLWRMRHDITHVVSAWDEFIKASLSPFALGNVVREKMKRVENEIERLRLHYCGEEEEG